MKIEKVKILKSIFDEKANLIIWEVENVDNKGKMKFAWHPSDLGKSLNIKSKIPKDLMKKFLKDIEGKVINLKTEADNIIDNVDVKNEDSINEANDNMNKYPFYEIVDHIKNTKEEDV